MKTVEMGGRPRDGPVYETRCDTRRHGQASPQEDWTAVSVHSSQSRSCMETDDAHFVSRANMIDLHRAHHITTQDQFLIPSSTQNHTRAWNHTRTSCTRPRMMRNTSALFSSRSTRLSLVIVTVPFVGLYLGPARRMILAVASSLSL